MPLLLRTCGLGGQGSALRKSKVGGFLTTASFWAHRAQEGFSIVIGLGRAKETAESSSGTASTVGRCPGGYRGQGNVSEASSGEEAPQRDAEPESGLSPIICHFQLKRLTVH